MEIVDGTREELYWGKVPEKVRRQAVEKAAGNAGVEPSSRASAVDEQETRQPVRNRKRRKHDS